MNHTLAIWVVVGGAFLAANLPFLNERWLLCGPRPAGSVKPLWGRLLELCVLYFLVGLMARAMEDYAGQVYSQGWEFYVITACLFLTLAFPGFVFRYLAAGVRGGDESI